VGISDFSGVDAIVATNVHVYLSDISDTSALDDVAKVYGTLQNFNHHGPVFPALRSVCVNFDTSIKSGAPAAVEFPSLQAIKLNGGAGGGSSFSGSYHLDLPKLTFNRGTLYVGAPALPFDVINLPSLKFVGTLHFGQEKYITNPPNQSQHTQVVLSSLTFVNYVWLQRIERSFEIASISPKLWCIGKPSNVSESFIIYDSKPHSSYTLPFQNISYLEGGVKFAYNGNYINCQQFSQFWNGTTCVGGSLANCNYGCSGSYPTCP
jgi:hypothetical protein